MQRAKHVPYRPAVIILIFTFLLITTACRNTEDISDAYSNSSASAATENENEKINAVETSEQPIVRSASKEMPVMNLKEAAPGKGWEVLKSSDLEFAGGKKLTVKCCGQVAVDAREIRAFLEYGGKSFEIGTISNYGMDQVYIQMIELTGDSTEELTITGDMGSTISVTKILGYDARGCFWTQLLDADNTIMTDLDTDGTMEVTSCSKGSLPSYLWIYKWNGKAYSMLDAAAATGNEYALLKELDSGCCIEAGEVRQGEKPDYHYYFYRDGKLIPHSDAFLREKDYILPESSERTLKEDDIEYLTNDGLNLAIQEIYARHGLIFKDEAYGSYFTQKSWYVMNEAYDEKLLSSIEKQNAAFLKQEAEKSGMYFSKVEGNTAKLDLNGDKVKDLVRLECEPGSNSYTLYINDISVTGDGDNLDGVLFLCDINKSDRYNELAVTESGPSGDYRTYFYCYDGKQIRFMGVIQGSGPSVRMTGDGTFTSKTRGLLLQTWFYTEYYMLSISHKIERIPQETYRMNTMVTVKKQLQLQKSPADEQTAVILEPWEDVRLTLCDNKQWCEVENAKGEKGWFAVEQFDVIKGTGLSASVYFDGLSYAD